MQKHLIVSIFLIGLAMGGILLLIYFSPTVSNAAGLNHPVYAGMKIGGDGAARIAPITGLAFIFQVLVLAQFACFVALGVAEKRRNLTFFGALTVCYLITVFVWWRLFAGHQAFLNSGETHYFLGFPTATAWAVYGIYLAGVSFIALYVLGFKQFVWSDQDEEDFQQLIKNNQSTPQ